MKFFLFLIALLATAEAFATDWMEPQRKGTTVYFYSQTHNEVGNVADMASPPTYRIYINATNTPVATGSMSLLDSTNTDGLYYGSLVTDVLDTGVYTIRVLADNNGTLSGELTSFRLLDSLSLEQRNYYENYFVAGQEELAVPHTMTSVAGTVTGAVSRLATNNGETVSIATSGGVITKTRFKFEIGKNSVPSRFILSGSATGGNLGNDFVLKAGGVNGDSVPVDSVVMPGTEGEVIVDLPTQAEWDALDLGVDILTGEDMVLQLESNSTSGLTAVIDSMEVEYYPSGTQRQAIIATDTDRLPAIEGAVISTGPKLPETVTVTGGESTGDLLDLAEVDAEFMNFSYSTGAVQVVFDFYGIDLESKDNFVFTYQILNDAEAAITYEIYDWVAEQWEGQTEISATTWAEVVIGELDAQYVGTGLDEGRVRFRFPFSSSIADLQIDQLVTTGDTTVNNKVDSLALDVAAIEPGNPISPFSELDGKIWRFDSVGQLTGKPVIRELDEFNGLLILDLDKVIPKNTSIESAELVSVTNSGNIEVTTPLYITPNKRKVGLVVNTSTENEYVFIVRVTTTDSQQFVRKSILVIE